MDGVSFHNIYKKGAELRLKKAQLNSPTQFVLKFQIGLKLSCKHKSFLAGVVLKSNWHVEITKT